MGDSLKGYDEMLDEQNAYATRPDIGWEWARISDARYRLRERFVTPSKFEELGHLPMDILDDIKTLVDWVGTDVCACGHRRVEHLDTRVTKYVDECSGTARADPERPCTCRKFVRHNAITLKWVRLTTDV